MVDEEAKSKMINNSCNPRHWMANARNRFNECHLAKQQHCTTQRQYQQQSKQQNQQQSPIDYSKWNLILLLLTVLMLPYQMATANMATTSVLTTTITTIATTMDQTMQFTTTTISPAIAKFTTMLPTEDGSTKITTIAQCTNTSCPLIAATEEIKSQLTHNSVGSKENSKEQNENETIELYQTTMRLNEDNENLSTEQTNIVGVNVHEDQEKSHVEEVVNTVASSYHNNQNSQESIQPVESSNDVNNEILAVIEERPEIKLFPSDNTDPTENLEESIRNSVKNEIEMEQRLESSPVLEILKEIPEPEIREILREDMSISPSVLQQHEAMVPRYEKLANNKAPKFMPIIMPEVTERITTNIENVTAQNPNQSSRNARKLHLEKENQNTAINHEEVPIEDDFPTSTIESDEVTQTENYMNAMELNFVTTTSTTPDLANNMHIIVENNTDLEDASALSIYLDESFAVTDAINSQEAIWNMTNNASYWQDDISIEKDTTATPEETEHMIIKKVLNNSNIMTTTTMITWANELQQFNEQYPNDDIKPSLLNTEKNFETGSGDNEHLLSTTESEKPLRSKIGKSIIIAGEDLLLTDENDVQALRQQLTATDDTLQADWSIILSQETTEKYSQTETQTKEYSNPESMEKISISTTTEGYNSEQQDEDNSHDKSDLTTNRDVSETSTVDSVRISTTINNNSDEIDGILTTTEFEKEQMDDSAATLFKIYPPQAAEQTVDEKVTIETSALGEALLVMKNEHQNPSSLIIILTLSIAFLFIVLSIIIYFISYQRQRGTLDIEMQERNCGKDNISEEEAETFTKLLEVELPKSLVDTCDETEHCL